MKNQADWIGEAREGIGPLMNTLFSRQRQLRSMIEQPVGQYEGYAVTYAPDQTRRMCFDVGGHRLALMIKTSPRGSVRVIMDTVTQGWASAADRQTSDIIAFLNAIRNALGMPPYDAVKEPWSPLR